MAQATVTVRVISNRLPGLSGAARKAVSDEVKRAALEIQAGAQQKAPVKTGTLRRSISSQFPSDVSAVVGPSVEYGLYVEMGTRNMGARPFLRPAADAVLPGFPNRVRAILARL